MKTQILNGDCIEMMKTLPDRSVNCCVTSPPYFGLRDYGHEGQIGLEETPEAFVQKMVEVFREVKRVLRDDGTLWVNIGDSNWSASLERDADIEAMWGNRRGSDLSSGRENIPTHNRRGKMKRPDGVKPKDLLGIPWMLAFALRADGWYLRQDVIWHKPNPMPERKMDRCTKSHEHLFLLSKSSKYFWDDKGIEEKASDGSTRIRRDVWTVPVRHYKDAHFATFPPDLIRPCILAGCPKGGVVLDPFGGSGTTAAVANEENRNAILCELNPDYIPLINERLSKVQPNLL
jgi:site-specific DNA-methyltransferase (adenine-specific)